METSQDTKDFLNHMVFTLFTPVLLEQIFANPQNNLSKREETPIKDLQYYVMKMGERFDWKYQKIQNLLNVLDKVYPMIPYSLILREIAVDLDKKYSDHIEDSPEIFAINQLTGRIVQMDKRGIETYKHFAAFRTIEDAKIACRILSPIMEDLFKNGKKGQ